MLSHKKLHTKQEIELWNVLILTADDLPYFRTLHSLAFRRLGLQKRKCNADLDTIEDFGKKIGFPVDYMEYDDEESGIFTTKSDYLRIIQLAKIT